MQSFCAIIVKLLFKTLFKIMLKNIFNMHHNLLKHLKLLASCLALLFALTACGSITHSGTIILENEYEKVTQNTPKDEVQEYMGSPSFTSYEEDTWYYVHTIWSRTLFLPYRLKERRLINITFTEDNLVASKEITDLTQHKTIKPDDRVTPTLGVKKTIFNEIFGNIGSIQQ